MFFFTAAKGGRKSKSQGCSTVIIGITSLTLTERLNELNTTAALTEKGQKRKRKKMNLKTIEKKLTPEQKQKFAEAVRKAAMDLDKCAHGPSARKVSAEVKALFRKSSVVRYAMKIVSGDESLSLMKKASELVELESEFEKLHRECWTAVYREVPEADDGRNWSYCEECGVVELGEDIRMHRSKVLLARLKGNIPDDLYEALACKESQDIIRANEEPEEAARAFRELLAKKDQVLGCNNVHDIISPKKNKDQKEDIN